MGGKEMLQVANYEFIRKQQFVLGKSIRQIFEKMDILCKSFEKP